jgi:hypothetical protein
MDPTHPTQVHYFMQKSNAKYNKRYNQHGVSHKFQVGDKVWFHMQKKQVIGLTRSAYHFDMGLKISPKIVMAHMIMTNSIPMLA